MEMAGDEFHQKVYEGYKLAQQRHPERIISIQVPGTKYQTQDTIRNYLREHNFIK